MKCNNEMRKRIVLYIISGGQNSKMIKFKALMLSYFEETFITIDLCIKQIIPASIIIVCWV